MTDLPSSLGIEAVECVAEGGPSLTVRVVGRWRRRRPEVRGQATLVVETEAGRQRFQAMPEPPSLTGAAPGTWRMSFSVPAALAPVLPGHTFLQLGGVMVPLPIGEVTIAEGPSAEVLEERRIRGSELAAESARRRAAELADSVRRLEGELEQAREQSDQLRDEIAERERRLRGAEQHAHAERALRADLEQELASRTQSAQRDLSALHGRVAELERELGRLRRAVDEAGHLTAAAEARLAEAERRLAERPPPPAVTVIPPVAEAPPPGDAARAELSRRELELDRLVRGARPGVPSARPAERAGDRVLLGIETAMVRPREERADPRVGELERQLAAAHEEVKAQRARSARAYEAIEMVRAELRQLRAAPPPDPPAPPPPPAPSRQPGRAGEAVQAEELSAALARLRERTPPVEPALADPAPVDLAPAEPATAARTPVDPAPAEPAPAEPAPAEPDPAPADPTAAARPEPARAAKPWLGSAFRRLASDDPSAAGRLVLALLPAQRAADPHPVAYDLVLSDVLVAHVTSDSLGVHVENDATARPRSEVDFQLVGDLSSVARLLRAGRVRRRLRIPPRRMARVVGDRARVAALDRLIDARLTARELHGAGVRLDPLLAFTLAALMIEPDWTVGERFTIGHRDPALTSPDAYLHIRNGRPPLASAEPPHGPVGAVLESAADDVLGALAGPIDAEERPLVLVRQWLDRAQSG